MQTLQFGLLVFFFFCININNNKCKSNLKEVLKKLCSKVTLMIMGGKKKKRKSIYSSHGVAIVLKKLEKFKLTVP